MSVLYSVETTLTISVTTLIRADAKEDAEHGARERQVETSWQQTGPGESALTHWIMTGVPAYLPKRADAKLKVRKL